MQTTTTKRSEAARAELFQRFMPVVQKTARRMARRLPSHIELDDLVSAGMVGLTEAVRRFDASRPDGFEGYVQRRVAGAIRDELRSLDPLTRDQRRATHKVQRAERAVSQKLGRAARSHEVAASLDISLDELHRIRETQAASQHVTAEVRDGSDEDGDLFERVADPTGENREESFDRREQLEQVAAAIEALPPRLRTVLALYYQEGMLLKEIGLTMGFSEARACQLHREAVDRVRVIAKAA